MKQLLILLIIAAQTPIQDLQDEWASKYTFKDFALTAATWEPYKPEMGWVVEYGERNIYRFVQGLETKPFNGLTVISRTWSTNGQYSQSAVTTSEYIIGKGLQEQTVEIELQYIKAQPAEPNERELLMETISNLPDPNDRVMWIELLEGLEK